MEQFFFIKYVLNHTEQKIIKIKFSINFMKQVKLTPSRKKKESADLALLG